ncbi:MAG: hypothetical protein IKR59_03915 [Lachnospiraceae bacterium]|nr:hypothetical protein [Lachnospiraceae bacterium]
MKRNWKGIMGRDGSGHGNGTIISRFRAYLADHRKVSDIVAFLAEEDREIRRLVKDNAITGEKEEEILEFADYFFAEFDDATYSARMRFFGEEPLILQLADRIALTRFTEEQSPAYESMTKVHQKEAQTLSETIFAVSGDKAVDFITDRETRYFDIPAVIYPEELPMMRLFCLYYCAWVIRERGMVTVEIIGRKKSQVFGIEVSPIGIWMPMSSRAMQAYDCTTPSGFELEPEDDVEYIEIERERF